MRRATEAAPLPLDTHEAQATRVAAHCTCHEGQYFSGAELADACDLGCATKVLSAMATAMDYGIAKAWRTVTCAHGTRTRRVRVYRITHGPRAAQIPLFTTA